MNSGNGMFSVPSVQTVCTLLPHSLLIFRRSLPASIMSARNVNREFQTTTNLLQYQGGLVPESDFEFKTFFVSGRTIDASLDRELHCIYLKSLGFGEFFLNSQFPPARKKNSKTTYAIKSASHKFSLKNNCQNPLSERQRKRASYSIRNLTRHFPYLGSGILDILMTRKTTTIFAEHGNDEI